MPFNVIDSQVDKKISNKNSSVTAVTKDVGSVTSYEINDEHSWTYQSRRMPTAHTDLG